jgi:hypothetical protein
VDVLNYYPKEKISYINKFGVNQMILDILTFLGYAFGVWAIAFMIYVGIDWRELKERFKK